MLDPPFYALRSVLFPQAPIRHSAQFSFLNPLNGFLVKKTRPSSLQRCFFIFTCTGLFSFFLSTFFFFFIFFFFFHQLWAFSFSPRVGKLGHQHSTTTYQTNNQKTNWWFTKQFFFPRIHNCKVNQVPAVIFFGWPPPYPPCCLGTWSERFSILGAGEIGANN